MPRFKCLACNTRLHSAESEADPIGDLCTVRGSLLEPVADLGEIVGYRVAGSPGSASHSGAEGAGQLIAGRVGEIIARRELKYARVRLEIGSCDAHSPNPQVRAARFRAPGTAKKPSDAAAALAPQPCLRDCRASSELSTRHVVGANGAARRSSHFALGLASNGVR
jgi:hypothetical protein